ncbi:HEAT repeat protein-like protein [Lindgomyces ingoldianus]|uniref:HEAT repeat protein-like protein n=1 Tax=Lindgomyces ingoldianus TaxID=673940 RepID=A0ACB6REN3_9PLEO|nr:HEAT repeat protein-like protein [Lindgomyces ingoldianus]KAF2477596.1 HEAT repeat protein-like protein [Lindgomyces ingoldianus]
MAEDLQSAGIPVPERTLRDFQGVIARILPQFAEQEQTNSLQDVVSPLLKTADVVDLPASHRAAACNILCAIIDACHASKVEYARNAILDDGIWFRLFEIFLQRSENAKAKSMRQVLLVLTNVLLKNQGTQSHQQRDRAVSTFLTIICHHQDRMQVKPALQGLAHFLSKGIISISGVVELYQTQQGGHNPLTSPQYIQLLFGEFLRWTTHHDTAPAAGHLIKNALIQIRASFKVEDMARANVVTFPLWIEPVITAIRRWPERIQEFKTNVFPHCFLPNMDEYLSFLSYLHLEHHISIKGQPPNQLRVHGDIRNNLEGFEEFSMLLAAIETGKELGIVKDVDCRLSNAIEVYGNCIHLPDDSFSSWLSHPTPRVQLAGLYLSVHSTAITRPITSGIFKSLKKNLPHIHANTDANFRGEVLGLVQRLFDRLRGSTAALAKSESKSRTGDRLSFPKRKEHVKARVQFSSENSSLLEHLDFISWYLNFLEWELRPGASYQRHITALKALTTVMRSGLDPGVPHRNLSKQAQGKLRWAHELHVPNLGLERLLLDLMLDPFDDVRSAAAFILQLCLESHPTKTNRATIFPYSNFLVRAELLMLQTGRADQADGVARAYSLIFSQSSKDPQSTQTASMGHMQTRSDIFIHLTDQLEETLRIAYNDISLAVNGRPVHGIFSALRYIVDQDQFYPDISQLSVTELDEWKKAHEQICTCFVTLWSCIRDVLCTDAPEGYVPEELEDEPSINTKEILSYSWRGLKEASVLLRAIVMKAPVGTTEFSLLNPKTFSMLGRLCFSQLADLRHRGAFSTVAQTFAAFCRRCVLDDDETLRALPETWYLETIMCIQDKATSITRRSAGIPSLMAGIVAADIQTGDSLLSRAIRDLIDEASQGAQSSNIEQSRLPQVHALNCLKEIFTTSRLSAASETYIGVGLDLAAKTLNSKIWPIRNSSLMLFKALIERLLGSNEAQEWTEQEQGKTSRFSYINFPNLVDILSNMLNTENASASSEEPSSSSSSLHGAEGVFPALQILQQAPPPESHRKSIVELVLRLTSSPHWYLRDMAARTYVSLQRPHEYYDNIIALLYSLPNSHNAQHGLLLCSKYMIAKLLRNSQDVECDAKLANLLEEFSSVFGKSKCPFTKAAFLDLAIICGVSISRKSLVSGSTLQASMKINAAVANVHRGSKYHKSRNALLRRAQSLQLIINYSILQRETFIGEGWPESPGNLRDDPFEFATGDADSLCALLELVSDIIQHSDPGSSVVSKTHLLHHIYTGVFPLAHHDVKSKAQFVMAKAFTNECLRAEFFKIESQRGMDRGIRSIDNFEGQCLEGSPSTMQSALRLLGYFLDFAFHAFPEQRRTLLPRFGRYVRLLRRTIEDTVPFDSRHAAVLSINGLHHIWTAQPENKSTSSIILCFTIILYDLLNDDDDEIRDTAAVVAAKLLRGQGHGHLRNLKDAVPIATSQRLTRFLCQSFTNSQDLCREALRRLTGAPSSMALFTRPFRDLLAEKREEDTALFVQEKQNLFKDDSIDAVIWSRVLKSLSLAAIPEAVVFGLKDWVLDGVSALTDMARNEVDGPLGWTTKPDVFALGMRLICAAEVTLYWPGGEKWRVRKALRKFADVGEMNGLNSFWVERIERVLADSIVNVVKGVCSSLPAL